MGKTKGPVKKATPKAKAAAAKPAKAAAKSAPPAKPAPPPKAAPAPKPVLVAKKPARPSRPSLPLPPPPPPPPPTREELAAPRDIGRLLRYGERFGAKKIDVRWSQLTLPASSGQLGICDPAVAKSWKVLDRPVGAGTFRVMLSLARPETGTGEELAALVIHVGRPPIAKWSAAHWKGTKPPKSEDQLPRWTITSGYLAVADAGSAAPGAFTVAAPTGIAPVEITLADGRRALAVPCPNGEYAAYWAVDPTDKAVCLVIDFDAFTQKEWKAKPK